MSEEEAIELHLKVMQERAWVRHMRSVNALSPRVQQYDQEQSALREKVGLPWWTQQSNGVLQ